MDLIVNTESMQEREELLPYKTIQDLVNERKMEMVFLCGFVKIFVIDIDPPLPILLWD